MTIAKFYAENIIIGLGPGYILQFFLLVISLKIFKPRFEAK